MQICSAYNSYGCSKLASGYRDVLYEASALGYHRTGEGHTLDLDKVDRIQAQCGTRSSKASWP